MRLHIIVISTAAVAFLCGCQSAVTPEPQSATQPTAVTRAQKDDDSVLPSEQVEKVLIDREKKKETEDDSKRQFDKRIEQKLKDKVDTALSGKDQQSLVRARLELGKFYRTKRRQHDALEALEQAVVDAEKLDKSDALYPEALMELGEAHLRLSEFEDAIEMFQRAETAIPSGGATSEFGETRAKMQARCAWAYRCQGQLEEAQAMLKQAKSGALKQGKDSSVYRVALVEEAIVAMDEKKEKNVDNLSKEIASLHTKPDGFGKVFLRICARNCRKSGQLEQEDFLEDHSQFFAEYEKAHRKTQ